MGVVMNIDVLRPRFWDFVEVAEDCWLWTGCLDPNGYGRFSTGHNSNRLVHRLGYEAMVGPVPDGLELDHLCRVPRCINPDHLDPVTHAENMRRGRNAQRSHCGRGHEYTPENTRWNAKGHRYCRACTNDRARRYQAARAARSADAPHGTVTGYNDWKCRCAECRSAWSAYQKKWKAARVD